MPGETLTDLHDTFARSAYEHVEDFLECEVNVETVRTLRTSITIEDCGEPLVPVPEGLVLADPHPYVQAGAPYGQLSPWQIRRSIADKLVQVQTHLDSLKPGFRLYVFDAYRPISVQAYMIEHECQRLAKEQRSADFSSLDQEQQKRIRSEVLQFWAVPNEDPCAPPPHSTGAAVDVTIVNAAGSSLDMGAPIDDLTEKAYPNYFVHKTTDETRAFHANRVLLHQVMRYAGFVRNPMEWWHFSYGDQAWALTVSLQTKYGMVSAIYGRA